MSTDILFWALRQKSGRAAENLVLIHLADRAGHADTAYPSVAYLSDRTGLNRKTIISAIDSLETRGLIFDTGERKGSTGQVKVYGFNKQLGTVPETGLFAETVPILPIETVPFFPERVPFFPETVPKTGHGYSLDTTKDTKTINTVSFSPKFDEFWKLYPNAAAKKKCEEKWKKNKLDEIADLIIEDVRRKSNSVDWLKEGGKYIPMSITYINQERWNDTKAIQEKAGRGLVV